MVQQPKHEWVGMSVDTERDHAACRSWFGRLVPDSWGPPLKAEVQVEIATDREKAIRALFRDPEGRLREAVRRIGARTFTIRTQRPSPGILKGFDPKAAAHEAANERRGA